MHRKIAFTLAIIAGMTGAPGNGFALELGMTPSNVFVLWANVNNALITVAGTSSGFAEGSAGIATMTANRFEGKTPGDVLKKVAAFRQKLDLLRQKSGLKPIEFNAFEAGDTVTPSMVFLDSGHALDGVVEWIVRNTTKDQLISPFYARLDVSGKTPSDAFAMVDLAVRRIGRILAKI